MNKQKVFDYIRDCYDAEDEHLFLRSPETAVFRHQSNNKWFAIYMPVSNDKLKLEGDGTSDILNVKCDPILIGSLLGKKGFFPAYHMNKYYWISINLNGDVDFDEITHLIELSYNLTI